MTSPPAVDTATFMELREASPAHLLFKIELFSLFNKYGIQKYETRVFQAGDHHNWKLVIYPNGHNTEGEGYVSVYLAMADATALPANWEVNAAFSICLLDHISGKYRYTLGRTRRFHAMKTEWGFQKFISTQDFTDPLNGYLIDDHCVFGAEVYVNKNTAVTECLSFKNVSTVPYKRIFMIGNFSKLKDIWYSDVFTAGGRKWKVSLYPNGDSQSDGRSLSIYLNNDDLKPSTPFQRVNISYSICIKDQSSDQHEHHKNTCNTWFTPANISWGWRSFIDLASLNDPDRGFIVNDCCLLEIELSVRAIAS